MQKLKQVLFLFLFVGTVYATEVPHFYGPLKQSAINNATITYYRFGQGKPLVMITGHGDSMLMWHPTFLKKISQNHEVIIFDYPGIGKSTIKGSYPATMAELSQLVQTFIVRQNLKSPDVLGFSMGGSLLLYMATQNGNLYDHIIVIGAKAGGPKTIPPQRKYFNMLADPSISPAIAIKTLLFPTSATNAANEYLKVLDNIPMEKMNKEALKAQAQAVDKENNGPGIWQQLGSINNPVLIINGTDDVLTPVNNAMLIAESIPSSWLVRVPGAGHGVLFQMPEFTAELVDLFVKKFK